MQTISIKAYAVKHKLSIFNVMKMVKSGKLKTEVVLENEREVTYIVLDEKTEEEVRLGTVPIDQKEDIDLKRTVQRLEQELRALRQEFNALKATLK